MASTKKWKKLSRTATHRKAMMCNMAASLLLNERIQTTLPKAKEIKRFVDRLISRSKKTDLAARRYLAAQIPDQKVQKKVFDVLVPRFSKRDGGYTRIFKIGQRLSDSTKMSIVQLIP